MKKIVSVLLATLMLFSTVFVGISATAETSAASLAPIEATPITNWTKDGGSWQTSTTAETLPLSFTTAKGIKMSLYSGYSGTSYVGPSEVKNSAAYSMIKTTDLTAGSATHFMFYVKIDAPNTILPLYTLNVGWSYDPARYLKGKNYSYAAIGDTEWSTATSNSDGSITFDGAFEGFIKYRMSDTSGDGAFTSATPITAIKVCVQNLGGEYGNVITGPYFLVNSDSDSTNINIPDEYKPAPIEATPITEFTKINATNGSVSVAQRTMPLSYTTAEGVVLTASSTVANSGVNFYFTETKKFNDIIIYVELPSANAIKIIMTQNASWPWDTIKANSGVQIAELGALTWTDRTVSADSKIVFDKAFKGYIKLNMATNFSASNSYNHAQIVLDGIGDGTTNYGKPVIGPIFDITANSPSTSIVVPEEYKTKPIEATPIVSYNKITSQNSGTVSVNERKIPLSYTTAEGVILKPVGSSAANTGVNFYFNETKKFNTIIVYVDLPSANALKLIMTQNASWPWDTIKAGSTVQIAKIGDEAWTDVTVSSDSKIVFDSAFKGYIKVNTTNNFSSSNSYNHIVITPDGVGNNGTTNYGNLIVGPLFEVTKDSPLAQITVPDEYKPGDIKVNPITDWNRVNYNSGTVSLSNTAPLEYTSANGIKMIPSNGAYTKPDTTAYASSPARTTVNMVTPYAIDGMEAFVLYLDMPAANTVYLNFTVNTASLNYSVSMALKPGTTYYTLAEGDSEWKEHTVEFLGLTTNTSIHGGIVFDSAFKGYVKFNPQNITCSDIVAPRSGAYIDRIDVCFKGIGGDFGNAIIAGPYFSVTSDSNSTNISINKVIGDIDKDAACNVTDLIILRSYIIGIDNKFVAANGNINGDNDGEIDICDLVYLAGIVDDIIFSADAYYQINSISADVKTLSAYISVPETVNSKNTSGVIFGSNNGAAASYLNFGLAANGQPVIANGTETLTFNGNAQTGDWAHLVYVIDDSLNTATVYLNGESLGSQAISGYTSVKNMTFVLGGDAVSGNANYFKGKIGEVALYSTALSETDVADIYAAGTASDADIALWDVSSTVAGKKITDKVGNNDLEAYTTFFDEKDEVADYAYSFAVVGDTQTLNINNGGEVAKIYDWILANKDDKKIEFVMGLGDITDSDANFEWETAKTQVSKLNGVIPYTVVRGNHDSVTKINTYLGTDAYIGQFKNDAEYYGFYADDESDIRNTYRTFTTSTGVKYLVMTLDFGPYDDVLTWADSVLSDEKFADYKVVITTHAYLYNNGTTLDSAEDGAATSYKYNGDSVNKIATNEDPNWSDLANDGDDIYDKLVSKHSNIVLVLSGHIINDEIVYRQDTYANGNVVTQMLIDPQGVDGKYNGVGLVALLYFSNDGNTITVEYYSTVKEQYFLRDNQFTIDVSNKN